MKKNLSRISIIIVLSFLLSAFAACANPEDETQGTGSSSPTETESSIITETDVADETGENDTETSTDKDTEDITDTDTEIDTDADTDVDTDADTDADTEESLLSDVEFGPTIELASSLVNGVQMNYTDPYHSSFRMENQTSSFEYPLNGLADQQLSYVKNPSGASYIENTMDVFLEMTDGSTYYASKSEVSNALNIYRLGYYYYEVRISNQDFVNGYTVTDKSENISLSAVNDLKLSKSDNGGVTLRVSSSSDPYFGLKNVEFTTEEYNAVQITMKSTTKDNVNGKWSIKILSNGQTNYGAVSGKSFLVDASGETVTHTVMLDELSNFTGNIQGVRIDLDNANVADTFEIDSINLVKADRVGLNTVKLLRSYHIYSDKLHETIQIAVTEETSGIAAIGTATNIPADTVNKIIVKDAAGTHSDIAEVDWSTAEYVGFDIKDAGIFGYIIPYGQTDSLEVTLADGVYTVIQKRAPEDNKLIPSGEYSESEGKYVSIKGYEDNVNDFYMGHRIYTDSSHDFDAFLHEAYCERNPLLGKNIKVSGANSDGSEFLGYDALRGIYTISVDGTGFNSVFYGAWNKHYRAQFTIGGDGVDRKIYIMTSAPTGSLECAALLNEEEMMLPIPIEVCKNFKGDGEYSLFFLDDSVFSEAIFPMVVTGEDRTELNLLNLYQNWGNYPLKQISSIQFVAPYYHLSTGVTESNCIIPFHRTSGDFLPDHRAASAPFWENQPQHTSGGYHRFFQYTDSEGNYCAGDNISNVIDSYGPVYADVEMTFLSDDGKIKASYKHTEFPQLDENRAFYEIRYEVLEDISFDDFKNDFSFYSVKTNNRTGVYQKLGYLDENNESKVVNANTSSEAAMYVLGDESPYFDYFHLTNVTGDQYVNVSFIIHSAEFTIGGEKADPDFIIRDLKNNIYLSLNLDKVDLKAGDTFTINAIITPWGSEQMNDGIIDVEEGNFEYDMVIDESTGELYNDKNVRDIRKNTCLNPYKAVAVSNCEVLDSVFVPKIKSTNGESAEFTLSGGADNCAVRVYGFEKLTAPKIYELVDGEWKYYDVSSYQGGVYDYMGNAHNYDGYSVHYDGDGTFSYSFIADMGTDGAPRTFRIVASEDFEGWDRVPEKEPYDPFNVYIDPIEIYQMAPVANYFGNKELALDASYFSFYPKEDEGEAFFTPFTNGEDEEKIVTGQYIVIKYRLPETNKNKISNVEFLTYTEDGASLGKNSYYLQKALIADGEWHVLILDLVKYAESKNGNRDLYPNDDGEYAISRVRFDVFNSKLDPSTRFDIAYFAIHDDLAEIREINSDLDTLTYATSEADTRYMDTKTGEIGGLIEIVEQPKEEETEAETEDLEGVTEDTTPAIIEYEAEHLYNNSKNSSSFKNVTLSDDGSYVTYTAKEAASADVSMMIFSNGTKAAGRYIYLLYRLPSTNGDKTLNVMEFYTSTVDSSPKGSGGTYFQKCLLNDGEWHLAIFDVISHGHNTTFRMNKDGQYVPKYLRFDIFNGKIADGLQIDIGAIGMSNNLDSIFTAHYDMQTATMSTTEANTQKIDSTVNPPVIDPNAPVHVRVTAQQLCEKAPSLTTLSDDGKYVTFTSVGAGESHFLLLKNNTEFTGQYMVIKYRVPTTNTKTYTRAEFYTSTTDSAANGGNGGCYQNAYIADGEWHVTVLDLTSHAKFGNNVTPAENGTYTILFNRFDVFNGEESGTQVEFEYIEFTNSLSRVFEQNPEFDSVRLCKTEADYVTLNKDLTETKG